MKVWKYQNNYLPLSKQLKIINVMEKSNSFLKLILITAIIYCLVSITVIAFKLPFAIVYWGWAAYVVINLSFLSIQKWLDSRYIKRQIRALQWAIDHFGDDEFYLSGLCSRLSRAIKLIYKQDYCDYDDIINYIPSFTRENCILLSEKYGFKTPHEEDAYWWQRYDFQESKAVRTACLNALITELKK